MAHRTESDCSVLSCFDRHDSPFFEYECASHRLRFEQHTEFDTLTVTQPLRAIHGIDQVNPLDLLDPVQLQACSQDLLVKTLVYVVPDAISHIGADHGF